MTAATALERERNLPRTTPTLTVALVAYNAGARLSACLSSLPGACGDISAEIILVDNASADQTAIDEAARIPGVTVIRNRDNLGFARASNQAMARAAGRYILLLNPDTLPPPGSLSALIAVLESRPEAFAVGPLLLYGDASPQFCWSRFPGFWSELSGRDARFQSPYPLTDFADPDKRAAMSPFAADWIGGACLLLRKSAVAAIGPLDDGFFLYGEETEWCHRAKKAGGNVLVAPNVTVTHFGGCGGLTGERRRHLFHARVRLYRTLYGPVVGLPAILAAAVRYALSGLRPRSEEAEGE